MNLMNYICLLGVIFDRKIIRSRNRTLLFRFLCLHKLHVLSSKHYFIRECKLNVNLIVCMTLSSSLVCLLMYLTLHLDPFQLSLIWQIAIFLLLQMFIPIFLEIESNPISLIYLDLSTLILSAICFALIAIIIRFYKKGTIEVV